MVNSLKKLSISLILISALFHSAKAEDYAELVIGPFGTLNDIDNSLTIPSAQAQDLLNVDITPNGKSFKKRSGYGLAYALGITTSATHGIYNFNDSSGNDVAISFNDTRMTAVINGGTPGVVFTNGPNGATYQCVDDLGFAYCANTSRSAIIKTNGVTSTNLVVVTTGTTVTNTPSRLVQAGFASVPNRIDFSKANDFTTWTVGGNPTDPIQFTITSPGERVVHVTYAFNRVMWFKTKSFGYILDGPTLNDWVVKTVSPNVGTLDNSSVYWNGILYFRGQDSHIYMFDGSNLQKMSREISNTINLTQNRRTNSSAQTTQGDFGSGLSFPAINLDTYTANGSVVTTFPDGFSSYRDGTSGTKQAWSYYESTVGTGSVSANGTLNIVNQGGSFARTSVYTAEPLMEFARGTTYHIQLSSMPSLAASTSRFYLTFTSYTVSAGVFPDANPNSFWFVEFRSTTPGKAYLIQADNNTETPTATSAAYNFPLNIDVWLATTSYQYSINGSLIGSGTHTWPNRKLYVYLSYMMGTGAGTLKLDDFGFAPSTSTYDSPVVNANALTTWDTLSVNSQNNGGTHTFYMRSSTNSIQINSSTPTWSSVTAGSVITISTGTYFQFRDLISVSTWTSAPSLDDFTVNWFEGSASDKSYMSYFEDAVWFSVTYGSAATTNNRILKYDLINNGWTIYDIASNGFYTRNLHLYFGSATSGNVFKYGDVNSDNGSAINAYWKSKDFFTANPFIENDFKNYSLSSNSVAGSSVTVTYTLNGSSSTSFVNSIYTANSSFTKNNRNLPLGKVGVTFNTKIGNDAVDQPFEIFGIKVGYVPKSWVPKP